MRNLLTTYGTFLKRCFALVLFAFLIFSISGVAQNFTEKKDLQTELNEEEIDVDNSEDENKEVEEATNLKIFYAFHSSRTGEVKHVKSVKKLQFNILNRSFLPNIPPPEQVL